MTKPDATSTPPSNKDKRRGQSQQSSKFDNTKEQSTSTQLQPKIKFPSHQFTWNLTFRFVLFQTIILFKGTNHFTTSSGSLSAIGKKKKKNIFSTWKLLVWAAGHKRRPKKTPPARRPLAPIAPGRAAVRPRPSRRAPAPAAAPGPGGSWPPAP